MAREKKALQTPKRPDRSVGTQAVLPAVGTNMHSAIYSAHEYSCPVLGGFNKMEQMKDVIHPGILSGQQRVILKGGEVRMCYAVISSVGFFFSVSQIDL